ncbi:hypothetical protein P7K49_026198 [Saguinus oedipus]|uniref:Uncharacterized protein n=1 Tax=Saguinus oedipus TaxID=9490 RepID=A0ABQ9UCJ8_SAGOE|nr:hypothetical protein P7K49_026198 [Saguinus oedipus]
MMGAVSNRKAHMPVLSRKSSGLDQNAAETKTRGKVSASPLGEVLITGCSLQHSDTELTGIREHGALKMSTPKMGLTLPCNPRR